MSAPSPSIVAYLMAGYPSPAKFAALLPRVAAVCDAVEIGVPFSDPVADGISIQRASRAALAQGTTVRDLIELLLSLRAAIPTPLFLMSYVNPLLSYGLAKLAGSLVACGVAGLIVPDLPLEESAPFRSALDARGLALVQLVTPLTPPARLLALCRSSRRFVYAVTVAGTTGGDVAAEAELTGYLDRVRAVSPVPVYAGFGIRSREQVRAIGRHADGVVLGSVLADLIERGEDPVPFLRSLRAA